MVPILKVDRVTMHFAGLAALREVSFELEPGRIYGLIGPNGAGKTTLLSIIAGSLRPTSGSILFEGRAFNGKAFEAVHAGIARTHQIPRPFRALSVLANVEVGACFGRDTKADPHNRREAARILQWVGLSHLAQSSAANLSAGDQKRLELARTLAARPNLLLCDEICSGLTSEETSSVLRLLREIQQAGTTILYVEHDLKVIMSLCDHVIVMNHGSKLVEGPPQAVQNDPAVIEAYIGKDADQVNGA